MALSRKIQKQIVLEYLQKYHSLTTLQGRNDLQMMGFAARIWELRHDGVNITKHMIPVGDTKMAKYTLLTSDQKKEVTDDAE